MGSEASIIQINQWSHQKPCSLLFYLDNPPLRTSLSTGQKYFSDFYSKNTIKETKRANVNIYITLERMK